MIKTIFDNILVTFEILHHMKTQKSKKSGFKPLKLDMSKTYNKVEWRFLEQTMVKILRTNFGEDGILRSMCFPSYELYKDSFLHYSSQWWAKRGYQAF